MTDGQMSVGVVLVGLMGSGKSSVARLVGERLGLKVYDTDRMVEKAAGKKIREIFAEDGEDRFRFLETEQLVSCLDSSMPCVVAAAGGVVLREANRNALLDVRRRGGAVVVWLTADTETLLARTRRGTHRPLIDDSPEQTLRNMSETRRDLYALVSDVMVDTTHLAAREVVDRVIGVMHSVTDGSAEK